MLGRLIDQFSILLIFIIFNELCWLDIAWFGRLCLKMSSFLHIFFPSHWIRFPDSISGLGHLLFAQFWCDFVLCYVIFIVLLCVVFVLCFVFCWVLCFLFCSVFLFCILLCLVVFCVLCCVMFSVFCFGVFCAFYWVLHCVVCFVSCCVLFRVLSYLSYFPAASYMLPLLSLSDIQSDVLICFVLYLVFWS